MACMELEFDVTITPAAMYDYLMRHTYNGMPGIIGAIAGAFCIMVFLVNRYVVYLIAGVIILAYLPISLQLKAYQQVKLTPAFKKPLHYRLTEEGIFVSQDGNEEMQSWDACYKAVSTKSSIILYTSKTTASIFPKKDLGQKTEALIQMISTYMPPGKVKIRF